MLAPGRRSTQKISCRVKSTPRKTASHAHRVFAERFLLINSRTLECRGGNRFSGTYSRSTSVSAGSPAVGDRCCSHGLSRTSRLNPRESGGSHKSGKRRAVYDKDISDQGGLNALLGGDLITLYIPKLEVFLRDFMCKCLNECAAWECSPLTKSLMTANGFAPDGVVKLPEVVICFNSGVLL